MRLTRDGSMEGVVDDGQAAASVTAEAGSTPTGAACITAKDTRTAMTAATTDVDMLLAS